MDCQLAVATTEAAQVLECPESVSWLRRAPRHDPKMLYLIIETFRGGDPVPAYRRFRDRGRLAPEGLRYVASWVTEDFRRCFQIMECDDRELVSQWTSRWEDLVEFEIVPVMISADAAAAIAPRL